MRPHVLYSGASSAAIVRMESELFAWGAGAADVNRYVQQAEAAVESLLLRLQVDTCVKMHV